MKATEAIHAIQAAYNDAVQRQLLDRLEYHDGYDTEDIAAVYPNVLDSQIIVRFKDGRTKGVKLEDVRRISVLDRFDGLMDPSIVGTVEFRYPCSPPPIDDELISKDGTWWVDGRFINFGYRDMLINIDHIVSIETGRYGDVYETPRLMLVGRDKSYDPKGVAYWEFLEILRNAQRG